MLSKRCSNISVRAASLMFMEVPPPLPHSCNYALDESHWGISLLLKGCGKNACGTRRRRQAATVRLCSACWLLVAAGPRHLGHSDSFKTEVAFQQRLPHQHQTMLLSSA
eukprot:3576424-Amphidinium_carterae.1